MAFSFNFDIKAKQDEYCQDDTNAGSDHEGSLKTVKDDTFSPSKPLKVAREHTIPCNVGKLLRNVVTEMVCVGALPPLVCVNESVLELTAEEWQGEEEEEEEEILRRVASQRSDLLPGVYEGGLRVWECTYDLLTHLDQGGVVFSGRRVLDLGCGAGLLGIMAMRLGAERVDFQDYNSTVIRQLTIANAALHQQGNGGDEEEEEWEREKRKVGEEGREEGDDEKRATQRKEEEERGEQRVKEKRGKGDQRAKQMEEENGEREGGGGQSESPPIKRRACPKPASIQAPLTSAPCCRFFSGDWTSFLLLLQQHGPAHKYDIILTSETIYNTAYYPALHEVLHRLLADDGQVLLATKAHYFGVGGGLLLFERFLEERGVFEMQQLLKVEEGLQRHVVSLTFKRGNTHISHALASKGTAQKATEV